MQSTELSDSPSGEVREPVTFRDIVRSEKILSALDKLGFVHPTPVQEATLPISLAGRDLIAQAKTGSGKTIAFGIPLLAVLEANAAERGTLALVLTPTRELANQICEVIRSLAPQVSPCCIIGGVSIAQQLRDLDRDNRVVVGTPGRILDLLQQRELVLGSCRFFAVDEVDEMFSMDFAEDVRDILKNLPRERQGMFVSATVTPRVEMFAKNFLTKPEKVIIDTPNEKLPDIEHCYCHVDGEVTAKVTALCDLIETTNPRSAIIFCNTKSDTELVEAYLRRRGFDARLINSDLNQRQRDGIMALIKAEKLRFLIGTDIAARGIDIDHIDLVVNYAIPDQHESYVHRTGRTGRAGRSGRAISLIGPQDFPGFQNLKRHLEIDFKDLPLPTEEAVADARFNHLLAVLKEMAVDCQPKELAVAARFIKEFGKLEAPTSEFVSMVGKLYRVLLEHNALLAHNATMTPPSEDGENVNSSAGGSSQYSDERRGSGRGPSRGGGGRDSYRGGNSNRGGSRGGGGGYGGGERRGGGRGRR